MLSGKVSENIKLEISASAYGNTKFSWREDRTEELSVKLTLPLFTPKANLVVWSQALEGFRTGPAVNGYKGMAGKSSGIKVGDIYVSTDIQLFSQEKHCVDVALRAALKSASGGDYEKARFYDSPGYFFDIAASRMFRFSGFSLTCAVSTGFLCWQTGVNAQNDAVMYGVIADLNTRVLNLKLHYGGYVGWQKNGDRPMVIRVDLYKRWRSLNFLVGYENGLHDFPYRRLKVGVEIAFNPR